MLGLVPLDVRAGALVIARHAGHLQYKLQDKVLHEHIQTHLRELCKLGTIPSKHSSVQPPVYGHMDKHHWGQSQNVAL